MKTGAAFNRHSREAYALLMVMILAGVSIIVFASAAKWTSSGIIVTERHNLYNRTTAAAEAATEVVLAKMLEERGLRIRRQAPVPIQLMGLTFDEGFRADILVEDVLLIELKSVENLAPVHSKQVLTYLRLLNLPLGLLINFGGATFKEGCKRIVRGHKDLASSRLRVNPVTGLQSKAVLRAERSPPHNP